MKRGSFILDGVNSEDVKTIIQSRPLIEAPLRKVTRTSSYGVDGDIPFDEGAYENTEMELLILVDGDDVINDRITIYDLLDGKGKYKEFIPYFDPDKVYRVMLMEKVKFENNYMYGQKQAATVKFTIKPYKYLVNNEPITIVGSTGSVFNPTKYIAQPTIKVTGVGPVTITVNGVDFNIKEVPNTITLNSERYIAYQEDVTGLLTPMNHLIYSKEYPIFKPGTNDISISGSVTELYIEPRWRSLL